MGQKKKLEEETVEDAENETTRRKRKRMAKAVVTVERQEQTLQAETAQHMDYNVSRRCGKYNHYASRYRTGADPKRDPRKRKSTPYEPVFYVSIHGSQITARCVTGGQTVCRDASQFKLANAVIDTTDEPCREE